MRRREDLKITKHTLNLFEGDYAKLQGLYGSRVGAAKIIRDLIHAHIRKIEATAAQTYVPQVNHDEIGIGELMTNGEQ